MKKMSEVEFQKKLNEIREENKYKYYTQKLKEEKGFVKDKRKIETSKILAVYLFILLNVIVAYSMIAMWHFKDLSYLGVLISDIAAQVVTYAVYCTKAYKSKKSEEELKYMKEQNVLSDDSHDKNVG